MKKYMDRPLDNPNCDNLHRLPRRSKLVSPRVIHPETRERPASCSTYQEQVTRINVDSADVPGVRSKSLSPRILRKETREKAVNFLLPPLPSAQCLVKRKTAIAKHSSGTNVEAWPSDKLARKNYSRTRERGKSDGIQARRFPQRLPPTELQPGSTSFETPSRHGPSDIQAGIPQRELFNEPKLEKTSRKQNTSKAPEGLLPRRVPVGLEGGDVLVRSPTTQMPPGVPRDQTTLEDRAQPDIYGKQKKDCLIPSPYLNDAISSISAPEKKLYPETVHSLPSSPTLPRRSKVTRQQRLYHNETDNYTSSVNVPCTNEANSYTSSTSAPERKRCPEKVRSLPSSPALSRSFRVTQQSYTRGSEFVRQQSDEKGFTKKRRPKHVQHAGLVAGHVSFDERLLHDTNNQSQLRLQTKNNSTSYTSHSTSDEPNFCSEAAGVLLSSFRDKETPGDQVNVSAACAGFVLEQENASLRLRRREDELACSGLDHRKPQKTVTITKKPQKFNPTEYSCGEEESQQRDGNLQKERHRKEQVEQTTFPLGYESPQILHTESLPFTFYQLPSYEEGQNCIEEGRSVLNAEQSTKPIKSCPVSPCFTSFKRPAMFKDVEDEADSQSQMERRRPNANKETDFPPMLCWGNFTATGQHCTTDSDTRSKTNKSQTLKSPNFSFSDRQTSRRNAICDALLPAEFYAKRSKFELLYVKCVLGETTLIAPYI